MSLHSFPLLVDMAGLSLNEGSSGTSEHDILAPLPHPACPWQLAQGFPYQYPLPQSYYPATCQEPTPNYGNGSAGSQQSEGRVHGGLTTAKNHSTENVLGLLTFEFLPPVNILWLCCSL